MAIRNDLTINWDLSPRIILVAAPSTEITIQDLYDTVRNISSSIDGIDEPEIIDGAGKENLGGGILVGLTITLINAKIKFADRVVPTECSIAGGNLVAVDSNGVAINPIQYTTNVTVTYAKSSSATMLQEEDIKTIKQILSGRWKLVDNQMIFYDSDNTTPLKIFNLKDSKGNPAMREVYERIPI